MNDYAGSWSANRGRCFRFVYNPTGEGRPEMCPDLVAGSGWRYEEYHGRWCALDACAEHLSQLVLPKDKTTLRPTLLTTLRLSKTPALLQA